MFYTYVLLSETTGKRYTGQTNNLEARLLSHNSGNSPFTKGRGPWKLIYSEEFQTRSDAMKREKFLKSGKGREFLDSFLKDS